MNVEAQLSKVTAPESPIEMGTIIEDSARTSPEGDVLEPKQTLKGDTSQTFIGEMSVFHSLDSKVSVGDHDRHGTRVQSSCSSRASIPPHARSSRHRRDKPFRYLSDLLGKHQVLPDKGEFNIILNRYLDEVYVLNPFIHIQRLKDLYEDLWRQAFRLPLDELARDYPRRLSIANVFLCLAAGASQESSRMVPVNNSYSAGYKFYSIALELLRPLLDPTQDHPILLQSLQSLALTVRF